MASKTRKPALSQAETAGLKKLRKVGLYKPKSSRAPPTKYAISLLKTYSDYLTGKASVVTAKSEIKRNKGYKEAASYKKTDKQKPGIVRVIRNKIVVPTQKGEIVRFSKKGMRVTRKVDGDYYVRTPFKGSTDTLEEIFAQLKPTDRVAIPLYRSARHGVEWQTVTQDEFRAFYTQYGPSGSATNKKGLPRLYDDLTSHIQIFHLEGPSAAEEIEPEHEVEYSPSKFSPSRKRGKKKAAKKKSKRKNRVI